MRARIDGELRPLDEEIKLDKRKNHTIEVVVDRLVMKPDRAAARSFDSRRRPSWPTGWCVVAVVDGEERLYSRETGVPGCGTSVPQLEPRSFSFNSPFGACETATAWAARGLSIRRR